jgi:hypothetical protein
LLIGYISTKDFEINDKLLISNLTKKQTKKEREGEPAKLNKALRGGATFIPRHQI